MLIDSVHGLFVVLVLVLLEPFLLAGICRHQRLDRLEITKSELRINLLRLGYRILLEILETDLHEMSFRNQFLIGLILVIEFHIGLHNLFFQFHLIYILQKAEGYNWGDNIPPRPFWNSMIDDLKDGRIMNAFANGMTAQGYTVTGTQGIDGLDEYKI